jgi:outer membrane protein TolC
MKLERDAIAAGPTTELLAPEPAPGEIFQRSPDASIIQAATDVDLFADALPLSDPVRVLPEPISTPYHVQLEAVVSTADASTASYTLAQILQRAQNDHPSIQAASREIDIARAGLVTAATKPNPNFVFDLETPVHDRDDPSQLTTRMTVPFGGKGERSFRRQVAMARLVKAEANLQATVAQVAAEATATALKVIYLQQRLTLERSDEQLARQQVEQLVEAPQREDPAGNLLDQIDARRKADQATKRRFATDRELRIARAQLANQIGSGAVSSVTVLGSFDEVPTTLPSLDEVLAIAEPDEETIAVALAELEESRAVHRLERNIRTSREIGPRYQDRLGRADDTVGVRLDFDLDVHGMQAGPIAETAQTTYRQQDRLTLARHLWVGEITSLYRELESLLEESQHYRDDRILEQQPSMLRDPSTAQLLTASQKLEIERAIVARQVDELERRFTIAWIRSQLGLDPAIGPWPPITLKSQLREPQQPDPPFPPVAAQDPRES